MHDDWGYECGFFIFLIVISLIFRGRYSPGYYGCGWWPFWFLFDDYYYDDLGPGWSASWRRKKKSRETGLPPPIAPSTVTTDPFFKDEELDRLIGNGELRKAREYLAGMIAIAKEVKDRRAEANYRQYESRIQSASMRSDVKPRQPVEENLRETEARETEAQARGAREHKAREHAAQERAAKMQQARERKAIEEKARAMAAREMETRMRERPAQTAGDKDEPEVTMEFLD